MRNSITLAAAVLGLLWAATALGSPRLTAQQRRPHPHRPPPSLTVSAKPLRVGDRVQVTWGGRLWAARVIAQRAGLHKVRYIGWSEQWDEWVEPTRIQRGPAKTLSSAQVRQAVSVEWHGRWWPGHVLASRAGLYKVHYDGWGNEWDEWVEVSRLASPTPQPTKQVAVSAGQGEPKR